MADIGTGITIAFGTSSFTAEILDVNPVDASRGSVNVSHQGTTTAHVFTPTDLIDWGDLSFTMQFDADDEPPLDQAAETITITFPVKSLATGATIAGTGFMTGFSVTAALEDKMTAEATIKWSGDLTWTDESA